MIADKAVPLWINHLDKKKEGDNFGPQDSAPKGDTVLKKIFRDLREFFRILFKSRFHALEYRTCTHADKCTKILLTELGIPIEHLSDYEIRKIFYFLHQTRLKSSDNYKSKYVESEDDMFAFDIIEKYRDSHKAIFMVDQTACKLFYTLYYNFREVYLEHMMSIYIQPVRDLIGNCLGCYESMHSNADLPEIVKVIFKAN